MKLSELLKGFSVIEGDREISGLALDSRQVKQGNAFVAVAGVENHGLKYAQQAIDRGAAVIIYEAPVIEEMLVDLSKVILIGLKELGLLFGFIAARYYQDPAKKLNVIGITGTNGKTSCSHFLAQALADCGIIGTLGWGQVNNLVKTDNTTPDALLIQKIMAEFVRQKKQAVAIEVSSHGLEQGRVNGVHFKGVVFTNVSRDHLDYHGSMQSYLQAKLSLFEKPGIEFAVINLDDQYCRQIIAAVPENVVCWGFSKLGKKFRQGETVAAIDVEHSQEGIGFTARWRNEQETISAPVFGDFNVENMLAVLATMLALKFTLPDAAQAMSKIRPVAGRMERIVNTDGMPAVFVDYAHTPDALEKALSSLKEHCSQILWVVFGCGGDRDKGKRSEMGRIAGQWANRIVLTDDNPRSEPSEKIINDILEGCQKEITEVIPDRKIAIKSVLDRASASDWVLIAGKGHEDYQEVKGVRVPFSDQMIVNESLSLPSGQIG